MAEATEKKSSTGRWLILLLLLLLIAGGAYWYLFLRDTGRFALRFEGCDKAGKCAQFTMFAPGYNYSFTKGKTSLAPIEGQVPDFTPEVASFMKEANKGVIVAGLASREAGETGAFDNRKLSACRSIAMSETIASVQKATGNTAPTYRVTLGRYAVAEEAGADTSVERLAVMVFIREADDGVDLSEAVRQGLANALPAALVKAFDRIKRQLDFTKYECWNDNDFKITVSNEARVACYPEQTDFNGMCSGLR